MLPSRIYFGLWIDIEIWSVFISSHFETLHPAHPLNFKLLSSPSLLGTSKAAVLQPCKHIFNHLHLYIQASEYKDGHISLFHKELS